MQGAGGVGGLLAENLAGNGVQFAAYDANGNVAALVSASSGTVTANYEYGPFGEVIRETGSMAKLNPFRFSTKYDDDETGLLYYGYRYYNPSTGRWPSRDPIGEKGGLNLYEAVLNNPINVTDDLGRFPNPFKPQPFPTNNINPPPAGPFSKCNIALNCNSTVSGQMHCGLVIDTGSGVYDLDGSGGTINSRFLVPGSTSDATGPWTSNPTSVCDCIFANITPWNNRNVPRDTACANSNWNLKCMNNKCGISLNWGSQSKPIGYNCQHCDGFTGNGIGGVCCKMVDLPCPDQ
jgi:RHS repeat-associated protein